MYPKMELKVDFGQVGNVLGRRELSGECKTNKCCQVAGFVCQSHKLCNLSSPGVQAAVICVVSAAHPCLPPGNSNSSLGKTFLGNFQGGTRLLCYQNSCYKTLYSCCFFFFFPQSGYEETIHCVCSGRSEFSVWDDCKSGCSYPGFRDS